MAGPAEGGMTPLYIPWQYVGGVLNLFLDANSRSGELTKPYKQRTVLWLAESGTRNVSAYLNLAAWANAAKKSGFTKEIGKISQKIGGTRSSEALL